MPRARSDRIYPVPFNRLKPVTTNRRRPRRPGRPWSGPGGQQHGEVIEVDRRAERVDEIPFADRNILIPSGQQYREVLEIDKAISG